MSSDQYARDIRGIARALWAGVLAYDQAFDLMVTTIRIGITRAWHEGAKSVGILPAELTATEQLALSNLIYTETSYIDGFLSAVETNNKASGAKLGAALTRAALWGNRYEDAKNQARLAAEGDPKLKWELGPTEHCSTCAKLAGKVKRASTWLAHGVQPQNPPNPSLECQGWNCKCILLPTDDRLSPGPLPKVP